MNHSKFAWRRFLTFFSASTIKKVIVLTDSKRPKVLIIDDSMFDRHQIEKVELLARCMDHSSLTNVCIKGFVCLLWIGQMALRLCFSISRF